MGGPSLNTPLFFPVLSSLNVTWFLRDSLLSLSLQEEKTKRKRGETTKEKKNVTMLFLFVIL